MQLITITGLVAFFAAGALSVPSGLELRTDCPSCPYCPPPKECPTPYPTPCPTPYCPKPEPCPTPYCPACPTPTPCPAPYCPRKNSIPKDPSKKNGQLISSIAPPKCPEPTPPPPCPTPYCPPPKWTPPPTCSGGYNYCKTSSGKYSKDMNSCMPSGGDTCCCKAKGILVSTYPLIQ